MSRPTQDPQPDELPDDAGFGTIPETRATLARLGVAFSDWPGMRAFAVLVAGRAYRLQIRHHGGPALFEIARAPDGTLQTCAVWHGQWEILAHLGAEVERQWSQRLRALPGQLVACYDEHGREVSPRHRPSRTTRAGSPACAARTGED